MRRRIEEGSGRADEILSALARFMPLSCWDRTTDWVEHATIDPDDLSPHHRLRFGRGGHPNPPITPDSLIRHACMSRSILPSYAREDHLDLLLLDIDVRIDAETVDLYTISDADRADMLRPWVSAADRLRIAPVWMLSGFRGFWMQIMWDDPLSREDCGRLTTDILAEVGARDGVTRSGRFEFRIDPGSLGSGVCRIPWSLHQKTANVSIHVDPDSGAPRPLGLLTLPDRSRACRTPGTPSMEIAAGTPPAAMPQGRGFFRASDSGDRSPPAQHNTPPNHCGCVIRVEGEWERDEIESDHATDSGSSPLQPPPNHCGDVIRQESGLEKNEIESESATDSGSSLHHHPPTSCGCVIRIEWDEDDPDDDLTRADLDPDPADEGCVHTMEEVAEMAREMFALLDRLSGVPHRGIRRDERDSGASPQHPPNPCGCVIRQEGGSERNGVESGTATDSDPATESERVSRSAPESESATESALESDPATESNPGSDAATDSGPFDHFRWSWEDVIDEAGGRTEIGGMGWRDLVITDAPDGSKWSMLVAGGNIALVSARMKHDLGFVDWDLLKGEYGRHYSSSDHSNGGTISDWIDGWRRRTRDGADIIPCSPGLTMEMVERCRRHAHEVVSSITGRGRRPREEDLFHVLLVMCRLAGGGEEFEASTDFIARRAGINPHPTWEEQVEAEGVMRDGDGEIIHARHHPSSERARDRLLRIMRHVVDLDPDAAPNGKPFRRISIGTNSVRDARVIGAGRAVGSTYRVNAEHPFWDGG